jgi:transposase
MAVAIARTDVTAAELRAEATRSDNSRVTRRLLALAMALDGHSREVAAEAGAMDRQTLRDWVHRFNAEGVRGLVDRRHPGRPPPLSAEQLSELAGWVDAGPELEKDGVVRWRRVDLRERIKARFNVTLDVRTVGKLLRKLQYRRISVRPLHPKTDAAAQEAFKDNFVALAKAAIPPAATGKPVEFWWMDEARVGQQGTLTRVWAKRGTRPRAWRDHRFTWAYLLGAICPARGVGAAVIMPEVNVEAMNEHLAEISRSVSVGAIALLVLDGAGWHSSPRLSIPENIVLLPLPPYSPELNPVENIWAFLRSNYLCHRVFDGYEAIIDACANAWNALMTLPDAIRSIAGTWAQVRI